MESLKKTALISGATSGMGYHLIRHLSKDGYSRVRIDDLQCTSPYNV